MALYLGRQKIAPVVDTIDVALADATESDVAKGKTFFSGNAELKTGTLEVPDLSATTATTADVLQGKKFYNAQGEFVEGTYQDSFQTYADVSGFNSLFSYYNGEIPYLSRLDTSKATVMYNMFSNCTATSLDLSNFNTSNVTDMNYMFNSCKSLTSLDLSSFDTSKVNNMSFMFSGCKVLRSIDLSSFNTTNVTNMSYMFRECEYLTSLDLSSFDTSNVTNMGYMFYTCPALKTIIGTIDLIKNTNYTAMLGINIKLETVTLKNIKRTISLGSGASYGTKLTNETLINTAQQLWDNTDNALGGSRTLELSTTSKTNMESIYVKLVDVTEEMIENDAYIANKKPCVVCESTDEGAMTLTEYIISKNWAVA